MTIDSGYGKPDTIVYQELVEKSVALALTTQKLCIIGPVNQVETDGNVGPYNVSDPLDGASDYAYPGLIDGASIDIGTVVVKSVKGSYTDVLEEGSDYVSTGDDVSLEAGITIPRPVDNSTSAVGNVSVDGITDSTADFLALSIKPGDTVYIVGPYPETQVVKEVLSPTSLSFEPVTIPGSDSITGVTNADTSFIDAGADFSSNGLTVKVTDVLVIVGTPNVEHSITEVTDLNTLVLATATAAVATDVEYYIKDSAVVQPVASYSLINNDVLGANGGSEILISYVAARTDLTLPIQVEETQDVYDAIGTDISLKNPMGLAASIAMLSGNAAFVMMPTIGTDYVAFQTAFAAVESSDVYYMVPLSMDESIKELAEDHVNDMSDPLVKKERVSLCASDFVARNTKVNDIMNPSVTLLTDDFWQVEAVGHDFAASNVVPGDLLYLENVTSISDASNVKSAVVYEVIGNENLKVKFADLDLEPNAHWTVSSVDFTKRQLSEYTRDVSDSIANRRNVRAWAPSFKKTINGEQITAPGYNYLVGLASDAASNVSQKPMSKTSVPGFDSMDYSNLGYFSENDLDVMASGGVMVIIQKGVGSDPEVRHQLTTDMSSIKSREFSFTKNVDFLVKDLRSALAGYTGSHNINKRLFDLMELSISSVFRSWKESRTKYGPKALSATLIDIKKSEIRADEIVAEIQVEVPLPNNRTTITLFV